jgi:Zn-dependent peptidase ImmA (M78 family)
MNVQPYPGTNKDIERLATMMRESLMPENGDTQLHHNHLLRQLTERTGGKIVVAEDPTEQEAEGGSLVIQGPKDYTIFLSPYTSPLRDTFTIGHEIGHYVLHYWPKRDEIPTPVWFTRYGTGLVEWQANRFAAALLMPEALFRKEWEAMSHDRPLLAGRFGVSQPAVETRAKSLRLLQEE